MKRIFLLVIILHQLSSCQKSEFENLILNPDKRWVYIDSSQLRNGANAICYMKFFSNGNCDNRFVSTEITYSSIDGNQKNDSWKYSKNDRILKIFNHKFKMLKYQKDTIHLLLIKDNLKKMLVNQNLQNLNN